MDNIKETKKHDDIPSVASGSIDNTSIAIGGVILAGLLTIGFLISSEFSKESKAAPIKAPPAIEFGQAAPNIAEPYIAEAKFLETREKARNEPDGSNIEMTRAALKRMEELEKQRLKRISSEQIIFDNKTAPEAIVTSSDNSVQEIASADFETRAPIILNDLETLIPQGTLIDATLETAIRSDLPGMVRAVLSRPVYGFQGQEIILPRGSRLIGEYDSNLVRGQSRIFIVWNRILRPDGVSISISSPGTDKLGRAGLGGDVDTRFFERFGASLLLSIVDGGIAAGISAASNEHSTNVAVSTGNGFSNAADIALKNSIDIKPRIRINQGTKIKVFLKQDLDFSLLR